MDADDMTLTLEIQARTARMLVWLETAIAAQERGDWDRHGNGDPRAFYGDPED